MSVDPNTVASLTEEGLRISLYREGSTYRADLAFKGSNHTYTGSSKEDYDDAVNRACILMRDELVRRVRFLNRVQGGGPDEH